MSSIRTRFAAAFDDEDLRETRPFFLILILAFIFLYATTLLENDSLRQPWPLALFTAGMLVHTLLHLASPLVIHTNGRLAAYTLVQVALILLLGSWGESLGLIVGLWLALAGELAGILETWPRALAAGLLILGGLTLHIGLLLGWSGLPAWLGLSGVMLTFALVYVLLYMRQLRAREEAQSLLAELKTAHRQLAEYAQRVESLTLETERQRLARELHDTLAQGLAGLILQLEGLEAHLEAGQVETAGGILSQAKLRARETLAEARQAIGDLRAPQMARVDSFRHEVERFSRATNIPCSLTLPKEIELPPAVGETLFLSLREGLANVANHAAAGRVRVAVAAADGEAVLKIVDDGRGFDPEQVPGGHYGLVGLRERARLAGGSLTIASEPGEGTRLEIRLPLNGAARSGGQR